MLPFKIIHVYFNSNFYRLKDCILLESICRQFAVMISHGKKKERPNSSRFQMWMKPLPANQPHGDVPASPADDEWDRDRTLCCAQDVRRGSKLQVADLTKVRCNAAPYSASQTHQGLANASKRQRWPLNALRGSVWIQWVNSGNAFSKWRGSKEMFAPRHQGCKAF